MLGSAAVWLAEGGGVQLGLIGGGGGSAGAGWAGGALGRGGGSMGGVVVIMQEQPTLSRSARMRARGIAKYFAFVRFITDFILALGWDWGKANDPSPTVGGRGRRR